MPTFFLITWLTNKQFQHYISFQLNSMQASVNQILQKISTQQLFQIKLSSSKIQDNFKHIMFCLKHLMQKQNRLEIHIQQKLHNVCTPEFIYTRLDQTTENLTILLKNSIQQAIEHQNQFLKQTFSLWRQQFTNIFINQKKNIPEQSNIQQDQIILLETKQQTNKLPSLLVQNSSLQKVSVQMQQPQKLLGFDQAILRIDSLQNLVSSLAKKIQILQSGYENKVEAAIFHVSSLDSTQNSQNPKQIKQNIQSWSFKQLEDNYKKESLKLQSVINLFQNEIKLINEQQSKFKEVQGIVQNLMIKQSVIDQENKTLQSHVSLLNLSINQFKQKLRNMEKRLIYIQDTPKFSQAASPTSRSQVYWSSSQSLIPASVIQRIQKLRGVICNMPTNQQLQQQLQILRLRLAKIQKDLQQKTKQSLEYQQANDKKRGYINYQLVKIDQKVEKSHSRLLQIQEQLSFKIIRIAKQFVSLKQNLLSGKQNLQCSSKQVEPKPKNSLESQSGSQLKSKLIRIKNQVIAQAKNIIEVLHFNKQLGVDMHKLENKFQQLKVILSKKVDLADFRKNVSYFESKFQARVFEKRDKDDDCRLIKRSWNCLSCDKRIGSGPGQSNELEKRAAVWNALPSRRVNFGKGQVISLPSIQQIK